MKWWYENEEEKMPFMTWVKTPDGYKPIEITDEEVVAENARRRGKRAEIWLDEANEMAKREKDKKMEFDKSRVFTAVNADELRAGDKVIVADQLSVLKQRVQEGKKDSAIVLQRINGEDWGRRFGFTMSDYALAYLVERAEKKMTIDEAIAHCRANSCEGKCKAEHEQLAEWLEELKAMKAEKKIGIEKHYRPFRDIDELIKVWLEKGSKWQKREITMPFIWVRRKNDPKDKGGLITGFGFKAISIGIEGNSMQDLFNEYTFFDGSLCGVEE